MKTTDELVHEITGSSNIRDYFERNQDELNLSGFPDYLNFWLKEKNRTKADVVRGSNQNKAYVYQIFSGKKYPSRDKVIALAFGLGLCAEETQTLLKQAGYRELYPRDPRDTLILFAISQNMGIIQTNELLYENDIGVLE